MEIGGKRGNNARERDGMRETVNVTMSGEGRYITGGNGYGRKKIVCGNTEVDLQRSY